MNIFSGNEPLIINACNRLQESNEPAQQLMQEFYCLTDKAVFCNIVKPFMSDTYFKLLSRMTDNEIKESIDYIANIDERILLYDETSSLQNLIKAHPALADWMYELLKTLMVNSTKGLYYMYMKQISSVIVSSVETKAKKLFKDIENISDQFKFILIYSGAEFIYINKPNIRKNVLGFIKKSCETENENELIEIYNLMNKIIQYDKSVARFFLEIAKQTLDKGTTNGVLIKRIVEILAEIHDMPEYRTLAKELLLRAQKLAGDDIRTVRVAARKLDQWDLLHSNAKIIQRLKSEDKNIQNWQWINEIKIDKPCVVMLGGDGTRNTRVSNGYLKKIEAKLNSVDLTDIDIYGAIYDFGDEQVACFPPIARMHQMKKYKRNLSLNQDMCSENINPEYVNQLFKILILPRISKNNERLPISEAIQYIRNLNIVAHCHGAYTFLKLEEMMQKTMTDLDYTSKDKALIQKQFVCIAHAPFFPLGASKSTVISFASIKDYNIKQYNHLQTELQKLDKNHQYKFSYFSDKNGDIFVSSQIFDMWFERDFVGIDTNDVEHDFTGYDASSNLLTYEGVVIKQLSGNTLVNAVKSSIEKAPIESVQNLVCGDNDYLNSMFETLKKNGQTMCQEVLKNLRTR